MALDMLGALQQGLQGRNQNLQHQNLVQQMGIDKEKHQMELSKERQKAMFQDARSLNQLVKAGNIQQASELINNRIADVDGLQGDSTQSKQIQQMFNEGLQSGDFSQLTQVLDGAEMIGINDGMLDSSNSDNMKKVQSSKILDDGTIITVLGSGERNVVSSSGEKLEGLAAKEAIENSRDQAFERKKEIKRLDQLIKRAERKEGVLTDQQKQIQKNNIVRMGALSSAASGRNSAMNKAMKFKSALESGEAFSGAGRKGAQFIPGVFTSQGQFDEEFNAFAEVAARQQLKASGETRPTDADVKGMKDAMFGVGRDEAVNIQLLTDFIKDQVTQTQELDQLIEASKSGNLSGFTFAPSISGNTNSNQDQAPKGLSAEEKAELEELRLKYGN